MNWSSPLWLLVCFREEYTKHNHYNGFWYLIHDLKYGIGYKADKKTYRIVRTLVFPLQQTGDFKSKITQFKARKL